VVTPVHVPAAYSPEKQFENFLRDVRCSTTQFAVIFPGLSQQRIDLGLRGTRPFSPEHLAHLERGMRELHELVDSVAPVSIDFRNVLGVKAALEQRRAQKEV
jgi:hypothetical protein